MRFIKKLLKIIGIGVVSIFVLLSILPYFFSPETKELNANEKPFSNSYFMVVNKTKIHYRVWVPTGKITHKVFLLHGFSGSTFSYRNNVDTLVALGTLVIAMDLPAFGFSDKSDTANYSTDNTFEAINKITSLYDSACAEKFVFVGHSMGASVVGVYASNFPNKVKSVILIDGVPFETPTGGWFINGLLSYPPLLRGANILTKYYFAKPDKFKELLSSAYNQPADSTSVNGYLLPFTYKNSGSAIFKMATANSTISFNKELFKKIHLLIIWGKNDTWIPIKAQQKFIKNYPKVKTYVIANAGHCPMETNAIEVNKVIARFVIE